MEYHELQKVVVHVIKFNIHESKYARGTADFISNTKVFGHAKVEIFIGDI